jgi:hypothetical protein
MICSTLFHLWNATMCMPGRWSYSYCTSGWFLLKSKPCILHSASGGITHRASLYCLISSMFPFLSALSSPPTPYHVPCICAWIDTLLI